MLKLHKCITARASLPLMYRAAIIAIVLLVSVALPFTPTRAAPSLQEANLGGRGAAFSLLPGIYLLDPQRGALQQVAAFHREPFAGERSAVTAR